MDSRGKVNIRLYSNYKRKNVVDVSGVTMTMEGGTIPIDDCFGMHLVYCCLS